MKTLKDIFYDLNDIMVAAVILAVAALVIFTNIDSILDYPSSVSAQVQMPEEETPTTYAENPPITNDITSGAIEGQETTGAGIDEVVNYSVYINYGETGDQIAEKLISVGLFKDKQQFYDVVRAADAEGRLQAGEFIIPSDSTPAEVVSILTQ